MRHTTAVLALLTFLACGSSPTSLDEGSSGSGLAASVQITQGQGQTVQVQAELPDSIVAIVRDNAGSPVTGDLVSFEVDGPPECGSWTASALTSNTSGRVQNALTAGTIAWTRQDVDCTFRVVHSESGAPEPLIDSVQVRVEPGAPVDGNTVDGRTGPSPLELPAFVVDSHGNPALWRVDADSLVTTQGSEFGSIDARTLVAQKDGDGFICFEVADSVVSGGTVRVSGSTIDVWKERRVAVDGPAWDPSACGL